MVSETEQTELFRVHFPYFELVSLMFLDAWEHTSPCIPLSIAELHDTFTILSGLTPIERLGFRYIRSIAWPNTPSSQRHSPTPLPSPPMKKIREILTSQTFFSQTRAHTRNYAFQFRAQLFPELRLHCSTFCAGSIAGHPGRNQTISLDPCHNYATQPRHMYLLHRLAIPQKLAMLFAPMHWTGGVDKRASTDFGRAADYMAQETENLLEVAVPEDGGFAEAWGQD